MIGSFALNAAINDGTLITNFSEDYTLTYTYTIENPTHIDENTLALFYFDEVEGEQVEIPNIDLDTTNKTITVSLNYFTDFVVMGDTLYGPGDAIIDLTSGSLSVSPNPIDFDPLGLTRENQSTTTQSTNWSAIDPTGSGWNITVKSTDFSDGSHTIPVANFEMKIDTANIGKDDPASGPKPTSQILSYTPLSDTAQKVLSAALNEGMGSYLFSPDFRLLVSADAYADSYTATVTVDIAAGP